MLYSIQKVREEKKAMWFENGKWMVTEKEFHEVAAQYNEVMNDKNASEELKNMMNDFMDSVEIAGI